MKGRTVAGGGDRNGILIPHAKVLPGVRRAHEGGTRHFADALCLYGAQRAQGAIPSLVLSIEEYLKGIYLATFHRRREGVPAAEWDLLQDHKFKLNVESSWPYEALGAETLAGICERHARDTLGSLDRLSPHVGSATMRIKKITMLAPGLQRLKLACLHHTWHGRDSRWDALGFLPEDARLALALYALHASRLYHELHVHSAERGSGMACPGECRTMSRVPKNPFMYYTGMGIMETARDAYFFADYGRSITMKIIGRCRRIATQGADRANLHPLVSTIHALASETSATQNRDREYSSNDSSQTRDGRPTMSVSASVSTEGGLTKIERVTINRDVCCVHDSRLAVALEAEELIGSDPGPNVPLPTVRELFSRLGISAYSNDDASVSLALADAHRMLAEGRLGGYPVQVTDSIRSATEENWDGQSQQARNVILALYVGNPAAVALSRNADLAQKHVARAVVWDALCSQKAVYDAQMP